ncbi:HPP family protein [Sporosalibacterium faouarense]|uniref:HPP family protein n=1 Tax=Sporosalibacterium faouarense TaxID=516123 RepID=UPI00141D2AF7|nr:HPP family protein [Sporosalibacterium faouarense]MTI47488.1 HPP family protein [Bacillota bacterium]
MKGRVIIQLFDKKAKPNIKRYILQCSLAAFTILLMLLFFNLFTQGSIITSLGATTFIVFAIPNSYTAQTRNIMGGYATGIFIGVIFHLLVIGLFNFFNSEMAFRLLYAVAGAISVGLTILILTVTNTEHPPAVGMALSLVLSKWNYVTILIILFCVVYMWLVKWILMKRNLLIDLK